MLTYSLDPSRPMPLYQQLYRAILADLLSGAIAGGTRLPSRRALAEHLNVSRVTVEAAYGQLLAEGYITSRPRSGYYAEQLELHPLPEPIPHREPVLPLPTPPTASASHFPFSVWAKLMRTVLLDHRELLLLPPPNTGLSQLRQAIAGLLHRSYGMNVSPDAIVIGAGAEYLYTILIQLLGRDLVYGLETPGHRKAWQVYEANAVSPRPVSLDESGVCLSSLEQSGSNVLHASPGHQFPTGIVMPITRRQQQMSWLGGSQDRWLIEDNYDSEFRFSGRIIPSMFSMDTTGRVIYLNTFSKTITPALRISYMVLPPALMQLYQAKLGFYSCTVPSFEQLTLAKFRDEGYFEKHVSRSKRRYRLLRDRLLELLRQSPLKHAVKICGADAGLHFLLKLNPFADTAELQRRLAQAGIRAYSLSDFYHPPRTQSQELLIQYSDLEEAELPRLVSLLEAMILGKETEGL